jgi:hypothetical protein
VRTAVTDGDGFFDVVVSPGTYRVTDARSGVRWTVVVASLRIADADLLVGPGG